MSHDLEYIKKLSSEDENTMSELCDEGINLLVRLLPPEEHGENEDAERLENILCILKYRLQYL